MLDAPGATEDQTCESCFQVGDERIRTLEMTRPASGVTAEFVEDFGGEGKVAGAGGVVDEVRLYFLKVLGRQRRLLKVLLSFSPRSL